MQILKRSGVLEDVKLEKITKSIAKKCSHIEGLDPTIIAVKVVSGIYDGVPSKELDLLAIKVANELSIDSPVYRDAASALMADYIRKEVVHQGIDTFSDSIEQTFQNGLVNQQTRDLVMENKDQFDNAIDFGNDRILKYFGLQILYDRYLLKHPTSRKVLENPQYMLMRVAAGLSYNAEEAIEFYKILSSTDYMTSTPTLFNSGTLHTQLSSCYVLDSPDDSISGIYEHIKDIAALSKFAGGIGLPVTRIRSDGALIKGTNGLSNGIVPWLHTLSASVAAVNQGGRRKGAAAVYLEPWHADIMDFLDLRKNTGDPEKRAYNLNLATWNPDLLFERAKANGKWSLFNPADTPDLVDLFGEEFNKRYEYYESQGIAKEVVDAKTIIRRIVTTLGETGNAWIGFKDRANERCNAAVEYPDRYVLVTEEGVSDSYTKGEDNSLEVKRGEETLTLQVEDLVAGDKITVWNREVTVKEVVFVESSKGVVHSSNLCVEIIEINSVGKPHYLTASELAQYSQDAFEVLGMKVYEYDTRMQKFLVYFGQEISVCNLGSVNVGSPNYVKEIDGKLQFDFSRLAEVVPHAVKFLDRVIDINFYPVTQAKASNSRLRPIGLGVMGLQDLFYRLRLPFDSPEALELSAKIQEEIYYWAVKESCELAKINGAHRDFKYTHAGQGKLQFDLAGVNRDNDPRWVELKKEIAVHGLRNAHLVAIAPTATIANICGVDECIEPTKRNMFKRETLSGDFLSINSFLVDDLISIGRWNETTKNQLIASDGSILGVPSLPSEFYQLYKSAWEHSQKTIIKHAAARQPFVDQSQSVNLFIDLNKYDPERRIAVLSSMYMFAYEEGLKTTYYLRGTSATKIQKVTVDANQNSAQEALLAPSDPDSCESCQ